MADGSFPTLVSKDRSSNSATNPIFVRLTDETDSSLIDGSGNLNVILAANSGVDIGDVDVLSIIPGTGATNLGKAEDAVHTSGDTGVMALAVRNDTLAALGATDGDYAPLQVDANGALYTTTTVTSNAEYADDSAFTIGTSEVVAMGALADETATDSVNEGDVGIPRMTLDRKLLVELADATTDSQRLSIDASGNIRTTWDGTAPPIGAGTEAAALRVTVATDSTGVLSVDDNAGSLTVDNSVLSVVGGGTEATAQRVTIANDSTGVLSIDDNGGSITVDGTVTATIGDTIADDSAFTIATDKVFPMGALVDETTPDSADEGDVGIPRMTADRKLIMEIADATTDANRLAINGSGEAQVDLAAVSVTAVPVSKDSSANSETNPLFVKLTETASSNEVHDYDTQAALASDTADNHDYTVTGTTFFLKSVIFSGSGNVKAEIQTGPVATLSTVAVAFLNGRAGDTKQINFDPPIEVPSTSTGTVRVIRTNRQGAATDVYSTILGYDV